MLIVPALGRWRQKDQEFKAKLLHKEFKANLSYISPYLKKNSVNLLVCVS